MTALWPNSLPQSPLVDGYSEIIKRPKVSFSPDVGPPIQRRKGTVKLSSISINMVMTSAQVEQFEAFHDDTLSGGALPFLFSHPRTENQITAWIPGDEPFQVNSISPSHWTVSFVLLVQS